MEWLGWSCSPTQFPEALEFGLLRQYQLFLLYQPISPCFHDVVAKPKEWRYDNLNHLSYLTSLQNEEKLSPELLTHCNFYEKARIM